MAGRATGHFFDALVPAKNHVHRALDSAAAAVQKQWVDESQGVAVNTRAV